MGIIHTKGPNHFMFKQVEGNKMLFFLPSGIFTNSILRNELSLSGVSLTLKAPTNIVADNNLNLFFNFFYFSEIISLDILCKSSAWQTIHMKCQDLFSMKDKKKSKLSFAAVVIGTLRNELSLSGVSLTIYCFNMNLE